MFSHRDLPSIPYTNPSLRQPLAAFPVRQQSPQLAAIATNFYQQQQAPPERPHSSATTTMNSPTMNSPMMNTATMNSSPSRSPAMNTVAMNGSSNSSIETLEEQEEPIEPDIEHLLHNSGDVIPAATGTAALEPGIVSVEFAAQTIENDSPTPLPEGFQWKIVQQESNNLDQFLTFVNDYGHLPGQPKQRPAYTRTYLDWLKPQILLSIMMTKKTTIAGTIGLFPICYAYDHCCVDSCFVGFLVVHPRLRNKGMESVLLKEAIRLANIKMNGLIVPTHKQQPLLEHLHPVTRSGFRWMCRPLNMEKLAQTLKHARPRQLQMLNQVYGIRPSKHIELFQRLTVETVPFAFTRYQQDCQEKRIRFRRAMNTAQFEDLYLPRDHLYSYVLQNGRGEIKDFVSFSVLNGANGFRYAYMNYITYPNDTILAILLKNILYIAKRLEADFFFILDIGATMSSVLNALKFKDTGTRTFYDLVNYRSGGPLAPQQCGLCLPL
jgi:GNAT superfamily N-acetyltransferase